MHEMPATNAKFRAAFGIPADHVLESIDSSASLTGASRTWEHHERDCEGRLVARYRSWYDESSEYGIDAGFKQVDTDGVVVRKGPLPF